MDGLIHLLSGTPIGNCIAWATAIIAAIAAIWASLEKYRKLVNEIESYKKEIESDHINISSLQTQVNDLKSQDITHYTQLQKSDQQILDSVSSLTNSVKDLQDYQKRKTIADLKDRIRHYYQIHHKTKRINHMELETMKGLIQVLEESNEHNSFVHEVIEPEMYTWELVDDEDTGLINEFDK